MDGVIKQMVGLKALQFAHATEMNYGEAVRAIERVLSGGRRVSSVTLEEALKAHVELQNRASD